MAGQHEGRERNQSAEECVGERDFPSIYLNWLALGGLPEFPFDPVRAIVNEGYGEHGCRHFPTARSEEVQHVKTKRIKSPIHALPGFGCSGIPLYLQLMEQVKHAVETGALREGDQLPTIRKPAEDLVMNPIPWFARTAPPSVGCSSS